MDSGRGECGTVINALTEEKTVRSRKCREAPLRGGGTTEGEAPGRVLGSADLAADDASWALTHGLSSRHGERPAWEGEGGFTGLLGPHQGWESVLRREQGSGRAGGNCAWIYIFNDFP